ncbi:MAG: DNA-deoxyinosine glycosylase [Victivallaceae bacterium]|nr:DNA-deoxyinosine glycosylase [Victivallaceae bacterium]
MVERRHIKFGAADGTATYAAPGNGGSGAADGKATECRSFPPGASADAELLILGSMPGRESLARHEYYAFKHNVFWRIMGELFDFSFELSYEERLAALRKRHVALWDVLAGCRRSGSLDAAIRDAVPNDIPGLLTSCPQIRLICCNGSTAARYLRRFFPDPGIPVAILPSTSPAAARFSYSGKLSAWRTAIRGAGL